MAETNEIELNLYNGKDFVEISRRENYYNNPDGRIDALILAKNTSSKTGSLYWVIIYNSKISECDLKKVK